MNLYKQFKTNEAAEVAGVWVPISGTAKIKVARTGNPRHDACIKRLCTPYLKPGMRVTDLSEETWKQITIEAMAEAILVDWEGITDDQDHTVPYSVEEAKKVLSLKDFLEFVSKIAVSMENFREARIAELEKNS